MVGADRHADWHGEGRTGGVLPGANVSISSHERAGEPNTQPTNEKGQLRFQALLPGLYTIEVSMPGFATHREEAMSIGAGATIERNVVLTLAGLTEAIEVEGGSQIEARGSGSDSLWRRLHQEHSRTTIQHVRFRQSRSGDFTHVAERRHGTACLPSARASTRTRSFWTAQLTALQRRGAVAEPGVDVIQEVQVQTPSERLPSSATSRALCHQRRHSDRVATFSQSRCFDYGESSA